jgi:hypothetical protein
MSISMKLNKRVILLFPSLIGAIFLGAASNGEENLVQAMLACEQPVMISQTNDREIQKYWKMDITVTAQTARGSAPNYEIMAYFEQTGSELSGQFVQTNNNACQDTAISGTVEGDNVEWTVFYTGDCCAGARMKFEGVMLSPNIIEGQLSPVGNTPPNCTLWWADVVLTRLVISSD